MRASGDEALREGHAGPFHGLQAHGSDDVRRLPQTHGIRDGHCADAGHQLCPVQQRQALLGLQRQRPEPGAFQGRATGHSAAASLRLTLADHHQREMGERSEVAGCADAAARRDEGMDPGVEHRAQQLRDGHAHARETYRQGVGS